MKEFIDKKVILWDFDGVIVNSHAIRDMGFERVLQKYPEEQVHKLMKYHHANGGLSRYVKFRYFFEEIRGEMSQEDKIQRFSEEFSSIMRDKLTSKSFLIPEVLQFIQKNHKNFLMHIVSGSDEEELKYICRQLEISTYFKSINGSPTPKIQLVKNLIRKEKYKNKHICLIGDSINDLEAARENGIDFFGYNNQELLTKSPGYISSFK